MSGGFDNQKMNQDMPNSDKDLPFCIEAAWRAEIDRRANESDKLNDSIPFQEAWSRIADVIYKLPKKNGSGTLPANR